MYMMHQADAACGDVTRYIDTSGNHRRPRHAAEILNVEGLCHRQRALDDDSRRLDRSRDQEKWTRKIPVASVSWV